MITQPHPSAPQAEAPDAPVSGGASPSAGGRPLGVRARAGLAAWVRDLGLGARFAIAGGRAGWTRTALTGIGVGLGVALLLLAASVPSILSSRGERGDARNVPVFYEESLKPGPHTFLYVNGSTAWHDQEIVGHLLRAEGAQPPTPPGTTGIPRPGEMLVSPALRDLLRSDDAKVLGERFAAYRVVGTIGDQGLRGPAELMFIAGNDKITEDNAQRADRFGRTGESEPMSAVLILLVVMVCVVLLMPVAMFIGTAVRFGGEQRDRRLAALRLVGADLRMTHRIAAGEALVGALFGLLVGTAFFLVGREFAGSVTVWDINVFPSDVAPHPALAVLVAVTVPACAVLVTLLAMRSIAIEPLGVVRSGAPKRRRLWWRLALPALGFALLLPMIGEVSYREGSDLNTYQVAAGAMLVLIGVTTLLAWLVEGFVNRFKHGPLSWQLAVRRLQLSSGTAARTISGVTVAVAGAIAIQMLFAGVQDDFETHTGLGPSDPNIAVIADVSNNDEVQHAISTVRGVHGTRDVVASIRSTFTLAGARPGTTDGTIETTLFISDCQSLRALFDLSSCKDGDTFLTQDGLSTPVRPGTRIDLAPDTQGEKGVPRPLWTVPQSSPVVKPTGVAPGDLANAIVATPKALPIEKLDTPAGLSMRLEVDPKAPDALEHLRNAMVRLDPTAGVDVYTDVERSQRFDNIQTGLFVGATVTLLLIGASMVVTQLEQLRERRRLLSVLVAFGTRRTTLAYSVLWQTAIPVVIGLLLSVLGGATLGVVLLKMVDRPVQDWSSMFPMVGIGAGVIALVTLTSLPPLWRMMRPDGLRTE